MVSKVKTDMPCCYRHKTLNITGNGTKTVLKSGRSKAKLNVKLSSARARMLERVCECQNTTVGGQRHQRPPEWDERQWHGQDERPRDGVAEKAHNRQAHIYSLGGQVEQNQGSHRAQWRSIVRHTRNTVYRSKSSDWTWRFLKCRLSSETKHHTGGTTKLPVDCS